MQLKGVGMSQRHTKPKQQGIYVVVRTQVKIFKLSFIAMP
jgi:hypothetical protein